MPANAVLAVVADLYTSALAFGTLIYIASALTRTQRLLAGVRLLAVVSGLAIAYGLMLLDQWLNIWPAFGLDYSTHTAVALAFVVFLSVAQPVVAVLWCASFAGYALLMVYLDYHTPADVITTGISFIIPTGLILAGLYKRYPFGADMAQDPDLCRR